ncbi:MAG: hypothetical protein JF614_30580 [Acidobacteria bacterium]|nr:hypothetical protein [Acidobacteriota bacterium]
MGLLHPPPSSPGLKVLAFLFIFVLAAAPRPAGAGVDRWTLLGPPGGQPDDLVFDPVDPAILYVDTNFAGLWKSADAGASWWRLPPGGASPLVIDPFDHRTLYSVSFDGIVRSSDGGATWTTLREVPSPIDIFVALTADPHTRGTLYALLFENGVLKSQDGGTTWSAASQGLEGLGLYRSLVQDPSRPGVLYVTTSQGVYTSPDAAAHWAPYSLTPDLNERDFKTLAVAPGSSGGGPATLYGTLWAEESGYCFFRSRQPGGPWTPVPLPSPPDGSFDCRELTVDPQDANRLYVAEPDGRLFRSSNGGDSWEIAGSGLAGFVKVRIDPRDRHVLYALSGFPDSRGLLKSRDDGSTWLPINQGFDNLYINSLEAPAGAPGTLYAVQAYGPVWKSADSGQTWTQLASTASLTPYSLAVDPFDPRHILLVTQAGLRVSHDGGASWAPPGGTLPGGVYSLAFHPYLQGSVVLAGESYSIFTSADGGETWQRGGDLFPGCDFCLVTFPPRFTFDPADPRHVFTVAAGQLLASRDGAAHWTAIPGAGSQVQVVAVDPSDPRTLYAGGCEGLSKSRDGGANWQPSYQGIPPGLPPTFSGGGPPLPPPYFCIDLLVIDPRHPATLYADRYGPLSQLYHSTDAGATWTLLASDFTRHLDDTLLVSLVLDPADPGRLYAATNSYGVVAGRFPGATPLRLGPPVGAAATPRFTVTAAWRDFADNTGPATPVRLGPDSGYFWFFAPGSLELAVKLLDGTVVNRHLWTFYASLSNVPFEVTVGDELTGAVHTYLNPAGRFASVADVRSLPSVPQVSAGVAAVSATPAVAELATTPCAAGPTSLCLGGRRFKAEVTWQNGKDHGDGQAVALADESGYFWFFGADVPEVFVKLLDGQAFNGHFWLFYGSLSDRHYVLRVQDLTTGAIRTYENPTGLLASAGDTTAF